MNKAFTASERTLLSYRNNIIQRCHNERNALYHMYGAKGYTVCDEWIANPRQFVDDIVSTIGSPAMKRATLKLKEGCTVYGKDSVVWEHSVRKGGRNPHSLTHAGMTMTMLQWSEYTGQHVSTLRNRIKVLGWSLDRALKKAEA